MPKKYPCVESTIDFILNNYQFRLWINEQIVDSQKEKNEYYITKIKELCESIQKNNYEKKKNLELLFKGIKNIVLNINACQIKEIGQKISHGIVVYYVDFADDVHG